MSAILNFSKAKKAKLKAQKESLSVQNRAKFGRTKAEKILNKARDDMNSKKLSDHKIED
jgi:hypothetical protein